MFGRGLLLGFLKQSVLETAPNQSGNMKGLSPNRLELFFSFPNHEIMQGVPQDIPFHDVLAAVNPLSIQEPAPAPHTGTVY